ncbi:MAG: hypothetical protein QOE30_2993, partial [Mycobacterium sp.]|uniref:DUF222 domain-containing protein n=1 Tax=Mycobacterium sp. TaxID=1785 RepID=UPI0028BC17D4
MFDSGDHDPGTAVGDPGAGMLGRLAAVVEEMQGLDLTSWPDEAVLRFVCGVEVQKIRQASADHVFLAEIEQRGLARVHGCASTAVLLQQMLHIVHEEAKARVKAAADLGPRRSLTGQVLEPVFAATAEHVAAGLVSPRHAAIITHAVRRLPPALAADIDLIVEGVLLEHAQQMDPSAFARFARDLIDRLDQDGNLGKENERHRHRDLSIRQRPDGSAKLAGELDATTTEALLAVLDTLARPNPATTENNGTPGADSADGAGSADGAAGAAGADGADGSARADGADGSGATSGGDATDGGVRQPDPRTAGQRRHDGLRDAL